MHAQEIVEVVGERIEQDPNRVGGEPATKAVSI
jgi:hypothetical protein